MILDNWGLASALPPTGVLTTDQPDQSATQIVAPRKHHNRGGVYSHRLRINLVLTLAQPAAALAPSAMLTSDQPPEPGSVIPWTRIIWSESLISLATRAPTYPGTVGTNEVGSGPTATSSTDYNRITLARCIPIHFTF